MGFDTLDFSASTAFITVDLRVATRQNTGQGADLLSGFEAVLAGSGGSDITGDGEANTLTGGAGGDTLRGEGGNDTMDGRDGADVLFGGAGDDVLNSGDFAPFNGGSFPTGPDSLNGDEGADTLTGSAGDTLNGGAGDDVLTGMLRLPFGIPEEVPASLIRIEGGGGADLITVMSLHSVIDGGAGDDNVIVRNTPRGRGLTRNEGDATVTLGAGLDRIQPFFPASVTVLDFTLSGASSDIFDLSLYLGTQEGRQFGYRLGRQGSDALVDAGFLARLVGVDAFAITQANWATPLPTTIWLFGTDGVDTLTARSAGDSVDGFGGDDVLIGGAGFDTLRGGAGDDLLRATAGQNDTVSGGAGFDTLDYTGQLAAVTVTLGGDIEAVNGGSGDDVLSAGAIAATLRGGDGVDRLTGGGAIDILEGGVGADRIVGSGGADSLRGGAGADVFAYLALTDSPIAAADVIEDFESGIDKIDLTALNLASTARVTIEVSGADRVLKVDRDADGQTDLSVLVRGALVQSDL